LDNIILGDRICSIDVEMHDDLSLDNDNNVMSLLYTSKEMRDLAWRSYYKHGIVLRSEFNGTGYRVIRHPSNLTAPYVRRVEVHLEVPNIFSAHRFWEDTSSNKPFKDMWQFLHFFRPIGREQHAKYWDLKVAWQRRLDRIETLKIVLEVKGTCGMPCLKGSESWKDMFRHVTVTTMARCVEVEVRGFQCGMIHESGKMEPCSFDCTGMVARGMREFILSQQGKAAGAMHQRV